MRAQQLVAEALADALLNGPAEPPRLVDRAAWALGRRHRWLAPLCRRAFRRFGSALPLVDRDRLAQWIRLDSGYQEAWNAARPPRVAHYVLEPPAMAPRKGALAACALPALAAPRDLADWLGIPLDTLDWLADIRGINPAQGPLSHYRYRWIEKRNGVRLIEAPKPRLRAIQRKILAGILDPVPVHAAAHGFHRGRSCRSYVAPHIGQDVVVHMDLRQFFQGIPAGRIDGVFRTLGYPSAVARLLTGLCTHRVPMSVARRGNVPWLEGKRLGLAHLPQGAPTSPALANLCALHLDLRLDALAASLDAAYTRYADDMAISGGERLRRRSTAVSSLVARIAVEEGFELHHRKTRVIPRSHRQVLTGIVVNERPNVRREEFDRLKAVLTNCVRHGPAGQNRAGIADFRGHLSGRVSHVASLNPARGAKLKKLLDRIDWSG
jgi:hypothetical protein